MNIFLTEFLCVAVLIYLKKYLHFWFDNEAITSYNKVKHPRTVPVPCHQYSHT